MTQYYVRTDGNDSNTGTADTAAGAWKTLQKAGNSATAGDDVRVRPGNYAGANLTQCGAAGARIAFRADPGVIIDTPASFGGVTAGFIGSGREYILIEGFTFAPLSGQSQWGAAIRFNAGTSGGVWRYGNQFWSNTCQPAPVSGSNGGVNTYYHTLYASWQDGVSIEGNAIYSGYNSGIYVANSSRNYHVKGNYLTGIGGNGIHNNGDLGAGSPGINYNALIDGNTLHNVGFGIGGQAISCDGVQDSIIRNNLIYDAFAKGMSYYAQNAAAGSKNNVIANNTVIGPTTASGSPFRLPGGGNTGNVVFNNAFLAQNTNINSDGHYSYSVEDSSNFDYDAITDPVQRQTSLASWRSQGNDVHGVAFDLSQLATFFMDPAIGDWRPKPGGPLAGTGVSSYLGKSAPTDDILSGARGSPPSIGAYE